MLFGGRYHYSCSSSHNVSASTNSVAAANPFTREVKESTKELATRTKEKNAGNETSTTRLHPNPPK